jgi:transposase-like protein
VSRTKPKYWGILIAEQEAGGQKVRAFCRERGIGEVSFYYWRKRLRKSDMVRFALLETTPAGTDSVASALELVLASGERLRIGGQVDADTLRMVLEVVRG